MSLTARDPALYHVSRDLGLVALSIICLPFTLGIVLLAKILDTLGLCRKPTGSTSAVPGVPTQPTILVTGVGMAKGLFLARSFYLSGCRVIAADFEPQGIPACGRYSRAVSQFYRVSKPKDGGKGLELYMQQVVDIVETEKIDLWVSCSGVATAIEDAKLMRQIAERTTCKAIQFDEAPTYNLDNKYEFMKQTTEFGLQSPKWYLLGSAADAERAVEDIQQTTPSKASDLYILKSVSMDDRTRGTLPLLNTSDPEQMTQVAASLDYRHGAQFILQKYIQGGEEFCTHSLVINGRVKAFLACRSASVLMHYEKLPPSSPLWTAMLGFTRKYAAKLQEKHGNFTGHFSFDFMLETQPTESGLIESLMPIECNPRCHTAVLLLRGTEPELTRSYLSILQDTTKSGLLVAPPSESAARPVYWASHDLVTLGIVPVYQFITQQLSFKESLRSLTDFRDHILFWKEGTFEWWDPLPWLALNHLCWPSILLASTLEGTRWSQLNVSTMKMFKL